MHCFTNIPHPHWWNTSIVTLLANYFMIITLLTNCVTQDGIITSNHHRGYILGEKVILQLGCLESSVVEQQDAFRGNIIHP